jgi:hypothetical protein
VKIRSTESTCGGGNKWPLHVGVRALRLWLVLCPRSREAAGKCGRRRLQSRCRGGAQGRHWVARKERNLYGPGVVHDGGVPHGSSEDPVVRALVLLRPPGKALLPRGRCEPHDISEHVMLRTKLETHVIMKSHMNVIYLQYRSLPMCRRSGLGAPGASRPARILSWSGTGGSGGVVGTYVTRARVLGRYH